MAEDTAIVEPAPQPRQEGEPHLGVFVGAEVYALPLQRLREVARLTSLRRIPGAAPHVAGMVNLRGEIICVMDTRAILGVPAGSPAGSGYVIALRDFEFPVGLLVDWITDIFPVEKSTVAPPPPGWRAEQKACVSGAAIVDAGRVGILDVDRVVLR
jgi:purine-binding chemotaxis protein CheW